MAENTKNEPAELKDNLETAKEKVEIPKTPESKIPDPGNKKNEEKEMTTKKHSEETDEGGFEIISKEAENVKHSIEEAIKKDSVEEKNIEDSSKETARKKSVVDISVIKESEETLNEVQNENLEETLKNMPGMTSSKSKEILKLSDEKELKQIAKDLVSKNDEEEEDEDEGSVIDIAVVNESDTDKEVEEVQENDTPSGFQAEIIDDDSEVNIVPAEDEEVVEFTLEMRHLLMIASAIIGLIAIFYAAIIYQNNV